MKKTFNHLFLIAFAIWMLTGCSQIGYVPLSDVEVDMDVQKQVRQTKKFMKKNAQPSNSQLPGSEKFMEKNIKKNPSQLPKSDKLYSMKKPSKRKEKKAYQKKVAKQSWFKWPPGKN